MKKLTILFIAAFALVANDVISQVDDSEKKSGIVFVEDGNNNPQSGRLYRSSAQGGASRSGNGNSNGAFGDIADWAVDLTVSEQSGEQAANSFQAYTNQGHPIYTAHSGDENYGDGSLSMIHAGMGSTGWGSFSANAYNRSSGVGSVAMGFHNMAGHPTINQNLSYDNMGAFAVGFSNRAWGNRSFVSGTRNLALADDSHAMGQWNYATGSATFALGKNNWAEGASTVAIGFENHAAGAGSVVLGQQNLGWGTTNFTAGYQNVAGDTRLAVGYAGSATAMGKYNFARGDASMALNRGTSALNQAATSMGLGTTADNVGMLAVGVNNLAGIGDLLGTAAADVENQLVGYYYVDGAYTGQNPGVAFVVGNGDVDSSTGLAGSNPSNAFIVNYDGSATLSGDLTINSDARLKSNIITLGSTLSKLLLIDGKSYTMKTNESIVKIGLLAQEVQKVFPELVKTSNDKEETLSVNYQGMIPVLLNAIKEQQAQIDELMELIKK